MNKIIICILALGGISFVPSCTTVERREPVTRTTTTEQTTTVRHPVTNTVETQTTRSY